MLIVTYNIQWGMGRDRRIDLGRIAETIAAADIIALQEVERNWREQDVPDQAMRLAELLAGFDWIYAAAVDLHGGRGRRRQIGNMTLSRKPIESTRTLPLPSRPVEGFVNDQQALSEAVVDGLRVYNTHLNYLGEDQRLDQAQRALSLIAEAPERGGPVTAPGVAALGPEDEWIVLPDGRLPTMPEPAILLGDFNCVPGSPTYRTIRAAGFADALELAGLGPHEGVTFPGSTPPLRLDHIFLSASLVPRFRRAWIDQDTVGSDHQPVWLDLA
jgi:endonuclease/exonuclease/phosphatase family metal-dependent hydrolase